MLNGIKIGYTIVSIVLQRSCRLLIISSYFKDDPLFASGKEKVTLEVDLKRTRDREGEHERTCLTTDMSQVETLCCNNAN
jgi:hypothetical protein